MAMGIETRAWAYALGRITTLLVLGVLLGLVIGKVPLGLAIALVVALAWNLVNLWRLDWWLRDRGGRDAPDAHGIWGDVIAQVVRLHRRKRYHKQRLLQVFREIRHSTAAMPDGVVVLNAQGEIIWFNRMGGRLLNLRRQADLGQRLSNLIRHPEFIRYLASGDFTHPLIVLPDAGGERPLSFQVVPYGANQQLILVRDVSRQVQLETQRKDFVANVSHELRSPLTVIAGYVEALEQDPGLDETLRPPLQEMRRQAERMTTIVRDLLELSRLDALDEAVDGEPVDVRAMAALLRKDIMARPDPPRVLLQLESTAKLRGDEQELHSAFSNLVDNAAKYSAPDGRVEIRWWIDDAGEGCFSVRDEGIGIPAEHLPRLTERFYRVDAARARTTGGTGLGLAIVKHVLQHHGARLDIVSAPGKGSTFTCRFPAHRVLREAHETTLTPGRAGTAAP
jgi:two-component system phosphate regulon sensor histidine kinase PhoR